MKRDMVTRDMILRDMILRDAMVRDWRLVYASFSQSVQVQDPALFLPSGQGQFSKLAQLGQCVMHPREFGRAAIPGIIGRFLVSLSRMVFPFLASLPCAYAEDIQPSRQVWLNPGFFSWHFDRSKDFREDNWGVGAEVVLTPDHAVMAGNYINSDRQRSRYAAYQWRPLHWRLYDIDVSAGIAVGVFDGYPKINDGGWFAALLPLLAVEGRRLGANISIVPTIKDELHGAVVLQIKLRVW